jgi:hypothetical protein
LGLGRKSAGITIMRIYTSILSKDISSQHKLNNGVEYEQKTALFVGACSERNTLA